MVTKVVVTSLLLVATLAGCDATIPRTLSKPTLSGSAIGSGSPLVEAQDLGRSDPHKSIRVALFLHYNREAELARLVDRLERANPPPYLTRSEFLSTYAPTVGQEQRAVDILRSHGFRVIQRFANRQVIDVSAPTMIVDRFFSTEMHDFRQNRYGVRSTNVRRLIIPKVLLSSVAMGDANNLVLVKPDVHITPIVAGALRSQDENVVQNGTFSTGTFSPWIECGNAEALISKEHPHGGSYDVLTGSISTSREPRGWSAICQSVVVPKGGTLSAWLYQVTNEPNEEAAYQQVALADSNGTPMVELAKTNRNHAGWVHYTWNFIQVRG